MSLPAELPLFPLNVVLFPGMLLPLHIFEPRYRRMLNLCVEEEIPFGLVLATNDELPHRVGVAAHIQQIERLADGRSNIITLGQERFRVTDFRHDFPYLVASVEEWPCPAQRGPHLAAYTAAARQAFGDYLDALRGAIGQDISVDEMPDEPDTLAYLIAVVLQVSLEQKQALLEAPILIDLLRWEQRLMHSETAILRYMERTRPLADDAGPISPN